MPLKNWELDYKLGESHIFYKSKNGKYIACIVMPHSGNDYKYMLRIASLKNFDRWISAEVEEYFDTFAEAEEHLNNYPC